MKKVLASLVLVAAALFIGSATANAAPTYPPPPVTSTVVLATSSAILPTTAGSTGLPTTAITVLPTFNSIPSVDTSTVVTTTTGVDANSLSYTGAGFNLPGAIGIAAIIVILGAGMTYFGARRIAKHR